MKLYLAVEYFFAPFPQCKPFTKTSVNVNDLQGLESATALSPLHIKLRSVLT